MHCDAHPHIDGLQVTRCGRRSSLTPDACLNWRRRHRRSHILVCRGVRKPSRTVIAAEAVAPTRARNRWHVLE
jgi:hypothetical protein